MLEPDLVHLEGVSKNETFALLDAQRGQIDPHVLQVVFLIHDEPRISARKTHEVIYAHLANVDDDLGLVAHEVHEGQLVRRNVVHSVGELGLQLKSNTLEGPFKFFYRSVWIFKCAHAENHCLFFWVKQRNQHSVLVL
jgi:hypothetical protein